MSSSHLHGGHDVDLWMGDVINWGVRQLFTLERPWREVEEKLHAAVDAHPGTTDQLRNKIDVDVLAGFFAQLMYRHARSIAEGAVRGGMVLRPPARPVYARSEDGEDIVPLFDAGSPMDRALKVATMLCLHAADTVLDTAGHRGPSIGDPTNRFHEPWVAFDRALARSKPGNNAVLGIMSLPADQVYQTTEFGRQLIEQAGPGLTEVVQCQLAFRQSVTALSVGATHEGPRFHFQLGLPTHLAEVYRQQLLQEGLSSDEIAAIQTGVYIAKWRDVNGIRVPIGKIHGIDTPGARDFDSKCSGRKPVALPTQRGQPQKGESAIKILADVVGILLPHTLLHGDERVRATQRVEEVTGDALGLTRGVVVDTAEQQSARSQGARELRFL